MVNEQYEVFMRILTKYFHKDYSYKAILHLMKIKFGLKISMRSLSRIFRRHGMKRKNIQESPPEQIVLAIVMEIRDVGCNLGYRAMWQRIRKVYQLKVKQKTVMSLLREIDPDGVEARCRYRLKRRLYKVPGPNFLWHSDNHDKLKRFGFPMYGFIDGSSRKVLSLEVMSTNNNPLVISNQYLKLVRKLKCTPTILRTDKGTEANIMGDLQIALRLNHEDDLAGLNSHIKGKSTHNQRIESYWREFRQHLGDAYSNIFKAMELDGMLQVDNKIHIECLRFCFGGVVKSYVLLTRKEWNEHHVRKQNGRDIQGGRPNELYAWPERLGKLDCRQPVDLDNIELALQEYSVEPHLCAPNFIELVDLIMPGTEVPTSNEEAIDLYQAILENLNAVLNEIRCED